MDTQIPIPMDPQIQVLSLKDQPFMPGIFLRLPALALRRPTEPPGNTPVIRGCIRRHRVYLDAGHIRRYRKVCGFTKDPKFLAAPPGYVQTLFIGLLGKYITLPWFPMNPLGLIQTRQTFEQTREIPAGSYLDLSCTLQDMMILEKGIQTRFLLEAFDGDCRVWQGTATCFTRTRHSGNRPAGSPARPYAPLPARETFCVPTRTGRRYASVSGDYNPHHLFALTARLIGFKRPIAHGMWSLARVLAHLEEAGLSGCPLGVDAGFKRPVFMPATVTLGYATPQILPHRITVPFDLRDTASRVPHLTGTLWVTPS